MRLGLREANQRFSAVIKAVRAGREVVLTDRGRPVAVITPIRDEETRATALQAKADEGLIRPASRKGPMPAPRWRPAFKDRPLSQTIIDDREERP